MPLIKVPWKSNGSERVAIKQAGNQIAFLRGGDKTPQPPRGVQAQPGSRKVVLTWNTDPANPPCKTKIYKDTESSLCDVKSEGVNYAEVSATTSATPAPINIFLSFVNVTGAESRKISLQCAPLPETSTSGPPTDPSPPPGWGSEPTGGDPVFKNPRIGNAGA